MARDFRYAIRVLLRSPLFTTVAALSLAIGIGGAATVFTVLNAVVLRSLPVPDPQQLYLAEKHTADEASPRYSWVLFEQAREEVKGRAELFAATNMTSMNVRIGGRTDPDAAQRSLVQLVSGEYFGVLRQRAQAGRLIEPHDNTTSASLVAVISDTFWERRFPHAADIVGRELIIGGTSLTIIGVASPGFFDPFLGVRNPEVWVPLVRPPESVTHSTQVRRGNRTLVSHGQHSRESNVLRDEVSRLGLTRGNLSWASAGLDTGRPGYTFGSTPQPHNEGNFTPLGRVIRGMDVVDRLELGDAITAARIAK